MTTAFSIIHDAAVERIGRQELERRLPEVKGPDEIIALPDDRYLSTMTRRIFRAGLKHSVVDAKWPAFEDAFDGFDPAAVAALTDGDFESLAANRRLIRHRGKLRAVLHNAQAMLAIAAEEGSFGNYLARWPTSRIVELWHALRSRFKQLGGRSGPAFLRMVGKDTFMLTQWVSRGLVRWGAMVEEPKGKRGERMAQEAFDVWATESGLPYGHMSMIVAATMD